MRAGTLTVLLGVWVLTGAPRAQIVEQTSGPQGAALSGVAELNGEIFASGRFSGVFSRSGGEWSFLPSETRLGRLYALGETLFASDGSYVYRSNDGETWERVFETPLSDLSFTADSVLVLANDSLFISADGTDWRSAITGRVVVDEEGIPTGEQLPQLSAAVQTPNGRTWVTPLPVPGVYVSEDGVTWREETDGLPEFAFPQGLFASTTGVLLTRVAGEVYQLDPSTQAWVERPIELPQSSVRKFAEAQGDVYALMNTPSTGESALFRLDGTEWTEIALPSGGVFEVGPSEDGLYVLTTGGLFEKVGGGAWEALHEGLVASYATPYALADDVAANGSSGWMKSTDEGATWQPADFPEGVTAIYSTGGDVVVGTTGDGVYRSLDAGETWQPASAGIDVGFGHRVRLRHVAAQNGAIYGGLYSIRSIKHEGGEIQGGVYRSTNDAQSWALFGSGFPTNADGLLAGVYQLGITENFLMAATEEGLYRIPLTGGAWESVGGPGSDRVHAIAFDGENAVVTTFDDVLVSEDEGATWSSLTAGLPDASYRKALAERDGNVYLFVIPFLETPPGLYVLGESAWEDAGAEIPQSVSWNSMIAQGEDLFLGTDNHGVWRLDDFLIGTDGPPAGGTDVAELAVFPNPARRQAMLSLRLPSASHVRIDILDVTGRRVATVHAGALSAQTNHRFVVEASDLAPGVYVVRAEGDGVRVNRTLTVIR